MLAVISPAKTLDFETPPAIDTHTQPLLLDQSAQLVKIARELSPDDLRELMGISAQLAELNHARFMNWKRPFKPTNAKQAILAFRGDVYTGLEADSFGADDFAFAQDHLRILSGLYGVLRPLDLIQPYRLEMGIKLANPRGANLYDFWGDRITAALNDALAETAAPVLINLASDEYFKSVNRKELAGDLITPVFKDRKGDAYKIISFYAKKARGMMSAFMIRERVDQPDGLKDFATGGYRYQPKLSSAQEWVFTRDQPV
jgi:cytoplasmic iron level regulating protein YaaA (DUF328/UPF0246 family)